MTRPPHFLRTLALAGTALLWTGCTSADPAQGAKHTRPQARAGAAELDSTSPGIGADGDSAASGAALSAASQNGGGTDLAAPGQQDTSKKIPKGLTPLASRVLAALVADDHAALVNERVDFDRYDDETLQVALSNVEVRTVPVEVLWANMNGRSTENEVVLLKRLAGKSLTLVGVDYDRVEFRGKYRLYRGVRLIAQDEQGESTTIQAIGGALEEDGQEEMAVLFYDTRAAPAPVPRVVSNTPTSSTGTSAAPTP